MKYKIGDRVRVISENINNPLNVMEIYEGIESDLEFSKNQYSKINEGIIVRFIEGIEGFMESCYALDVDDGVVAWDESELELIE